MRGRPPGPDEPGGLPFLCRKLAFAYLRQILRIQCKIFWYPREVLKACWHAGKQCRPRRLMSVNIAQIQIERPRASLQGDLPTLLQPGRLREQKRERLISRSSGKACISALDLAQVLLFLAGHNVI